MLYLPALFTKLDRPVHSVPNHLFSNSRKYSLFRYSPISLLMGRSHSDPRVNAKALVALLIGFSIFEKGQPRILEAATSSNGLGYMNASSFLWRYMKSHQELPMTTVLPKNYFHFPALHKYISMKNIFQDSPLQNRETFYRITLCQKHFRRQHQSNLPTMHFFNPLLHCFYPIRFHDMTNFSVLRIVTFNKEPLDGTVCQSGKCESRWRFLKLKKE